MVVTIVTIECIVTRETMNGVVACATFQGIRRIGTLRKNRGACCPGILEIVNVARPIPNEEVGVTVIVKIGQCRSIIATWIYTIKRICRAGAFFDYSHIYVLVTGKRCIITVNGRKKTLFR